MLLYIYVILVHSLSLFTCTQVETTPLHQPCAADGMHVIMMVVYTMNMINPRMNLLTCMKACPDRRGGLRRGGGGILGEMHPYAACFIIIIIMVNVDRIVLDNYTCKPHHYDLRFISKLRL